MFKYELHAHTAECDKCAELGGAELVSAYAEKGYSGIVITDHYFSGFYSWFADEIGDEHSSIIDRYLAGYRAARAEGEKIGFTVLPGAEVRIDGEINDYLVYGLCEEDFYALPLLNRQKSIEDVMALLPPSAVVVQAHPFRDNMTVKNPEILFGIEVYNGGTEAFRNRMARDFAEHYGKAMTAGSDCHGSGAVGRGGIETNRRITNEEDLSKTLKSGEYSLLGV
jgi:predicted metal-dependent phosphoesterase TrpH